MGFVQYYTGDPRISRKSLKSIDRFIQFDQNRKLPRMAKKKAVLFLHDLIPYVMESDYLWTYSTARLNGRSRKGSVKFAFQRLQYAARLKISAGRARTLIANSKHTKKDFVKALKIKSQKIHIAHLGVNAPTTNLDTSKPLFQDFTTTMWGVVKKEFDPSDKPYLFFTGGMDHRRKVVELLAAYNNLRARGIDISLIISGDTVEGIDDIRNTVIKSYLKNNLSYIDDIHLIGYADNKQRDWLYMHSLAFVFPSVYEGFGLPVLEAMNHGAPVITYNNTSISEVAGSKALYVTDFLGIVEQSTYLLHNPKQAAIIAQSGKKHASQYTWSQTKSAIIKSLEV
jgi:glycosyltransferase involved in cell wall biosynthesis